MKVTAILPVLLFASTASANDWPQACYNETSMWVTNACKTYIEQVYLPEQELTNAGPAPALGSGLGGLILLACTGAALVHRRRFGRRDDTTSP